VAPGREALHSLAVLGVVTTYTATLRDYSFGCAQEWDWDGELPSGIGPGQYRGIRADAVGRSGQRVTGPDYAGSNTLTFPLIYDTDPGSASDVELAAFRLLEAFAEEQTNELVELTLVMASGTYVIRGRPMAPALDLKQGYASFGRALVSFETIDPRWYSSTVKTATTGLPTLTGGLTTPIVTPIVTTGGGASGDIILENNGRKPAPWTATIIGPVTNPRLMLNGETVELNGGIGAGSTLTIDSDTGAIKLNGFTRPWLTFTSTWWEIPPGLSQFSFRASSGTGTVRLAWRDVYI
jgi:hypothetical protein